MVSSSISTVSRPWLLAWTNCKTPERRIEYLSRLAQNGNIAAISTLFHSRGVEIPQKEQINASYGELRGRVGARLFTEVEKVGKRFAAGKDFWEDSFSDDFWSGADRVEKTLACQTLNLAPKLSRLSTGKSPDEIVERLADGPKRVLTNQVTSLMGRPSGLLLWGLMMIADVMGKTDSLRKPPTKQDLENLLEGEQILYSCLDKRDFPHPSELPPNTQECVGQLFTPIAGYLLEHPDPPNPLETCRFLRAISRISMENSSQDRYTVCLRIARMSPDLEEKNSALREAVEIWEKLAVKDRDATVLCFEILQASDKKFVDFVKEKMGNRWWTSQLKEALETILIAKPECSENPSCSFMIKDLLKELLSLHEEEPLSEEIISLMAKVIDHGREHIFSNNLTQKLIELDDEYLPRLTQPYLLYGVKKRPAAWLILAMSLIRIETEYDKILERAFECDKDPKNIFLTTAFLIKHPHHHAAEGALARILAHIRKDRPRNKLEEASHQTMAYACYEYMARFDPLSEITKELLSHIQQDFPHIMVHRKIFDLLDSATLEEATEKITQIYDELPKVSSCDRSVCLISSLLFSFARRCPEEVHPQLFQRISAKLLYRNEQASNLIESFNPFRDFASQAIDQLFLRLATKYESEEGLSSESSEEEELAATAEEIGVGSIEEGPEEILAAIEPEVGAASVESVQKELPLGKKKLRELRRIERAQQESDPFQDQLKEIASNKSVSKRQLRDFFNQCLKKGFEVTSRKVCFPVLPKEAGLSILMNGYHPIHTKERPMPELKGIAKSMLERMGSSTKP